MESCKECKKLDSIFDTVSKSYYRLEDGTLLCYRHWHQAGRPEFEDKGNYSDVVPRKPKQNEKQQIIKRVRYGV